MKARTVILTEEECDNTIAGLYDTVTRKIGFNPNASRYSPSHVYCSPKVYDKVSAHYKAMGMGEDEISMRWVSMGPKVTIDSDGYVVFVEDGFLMSWSKKPKLKGKLFASREKKSYDELQIGKDYHETWRNTSKGPSDMGFFRVTSIHKNKGRKFVYGVSSNSQDGDHHHIQDSAYLGVAFDDVVPSDVSRKFGAMEKFAFVLKEGQILSGDFGYSMSLPSFYRVVKRTNSTAVLQKLRSVRRPVMDDSGYTGDFYAVPGQPDETPFKKKIKKDGFNEIVEGAYGETLRLWNGKPTRGNDYD